MSKNKDFNQQINKRTFAALLFVTSCTHFAMAQGLLDWITDPIGSAGAYIESKAMEAAGNIWEGVLESSIQSSLDENASKIAEFPIDGTTYPAQINSRFPQWSNNSNPLSSIRTKLAEAPIDYLRYNYKGGHIREFGKGAVYDRLAWQADSIKNENRVRELSAVLNRQALDSVIALQLDKDGTFLETLLEHPSLALVFNSHPELLRLNAEWKGLPIVNDAKQLQYWGTIANKEDMILPQKLRPCNLQTLKFSASSADLLQVSSKKGERIGTVSRSYVVTPKSIDLLNLHPMPKATYKVEKNTYTTDYLGRVMRVEQSSLEKEKSSLQKGKLKAKHFLTQQAAPAQSKPFFIISIKHKGTESRLNIVPLVMSDYNKKQLKAFDKKMKELSKRSTLFPVKYELFYTSVNDSQTPEYILINLNDSKFLLSNNPMNGSAEYVISNLEKQRK